MVKTQMVVSGMKTEIQMGKEEYEDEEEWGIMFKGRHYSEGSYVNGLRRWADINRRSDSVSVRVVSCQ